MSGAHVYPARELRPFDVTFPGRRPIRVEARDPRDARLVALNALGLRWMHAPVPQVEPVGLDLDKDSSQSTNITPIKKGRRT